MPARYCAIVSTLQWVAIRMLPHMKESTANGKSPLPGQQAKQVQHLNSDTCLGRHLESMLSRLATGTLQVFLVLMLEYIVSVRKIKRYSCSQASTTYNHA